jgi:hypothetical protein
MERDDGRLLHAEAGTARPLQNEKIKLRINSLYGYSVSGNRFRHWSCRFLCVYSQAAPFQSFRETASIPRSSLTGRAATKDCDSELD